MINYALEEQMFYHNLKNSNKSKLESYLEILKERHTTLDKKIKEGYTNYLTDKGMQKMKFEKAAIKREIEEVEGKLKAIQDEA